VIVCGGGVAGIAAALSAARNGCKVMLVERYGFLGGMSTAGLVITVPPMNNGLQKEIAERLQEMGGYAPLHTPSLEGDDVLSHSLDPEILKLAALKMLQEAGVHLLLHTIVVDVVFEKNTLTGVIVENKSGRQALRGKVVVDATGDGDIAFLAKAPFNLGDESGKMLPVTLMFNMVNVDTEKTLDSIGSFEKLRSITEESVKKGDLKFSLEAKATKNAPGVTAQTLVHKGELNVWGGSLHGVDGTNAKHLTEAEQVTREQGRILTDFIQSLSGFERSWISCTASQVGVRETRRITGEYLITREDLKRGEQFYDTVVKPYDHSGMQVPYRCLLPKTMDNLLVAGRCISGTSEAMTQLRLIPPCIASGQAAGTAAALSVKKNISPRKVDVAFLQHTLIQQGVELTLKKIE
jgi:ribulose 1,5-bisphosphate synthetase/thiazole synthase